MLELYWATSEEWHVVQICVPWEEDAFTSWRPQHRRSPWGHDFWLSQTGHAAGIRWRVLRESQFAARRQRYLTCRLSRYRAKLSMRTPPRS